jgi:hypothetical protein
MSRGRREELFAPALTLDRVILRVTFDVVCFLPNSHRASLKKRLSNTICEG